MGSEGSREATGWDGGTDGEEGKGGKRRIWKYREEGRIGREGRIEERKDVRRKGRGGRREDVEGGKDGE